MMFTLYQIAVFYSAVVSAVPFSQLQPRDDLNGDQLTLMKRYAQYAEAAYCYNNVNADMSKSPVINCKNEGGDCPDVDGFNAKILASISSKDTKHDSTDSSAYVAADEKNSVIVIGCQGTKNENNLKQWLTNFDLVEKKSDLCKDSNKKCKAHKGFYKAMDQMYKPVKDALDKARQDSKMKNYKVVVTGHSLGGAIAMLLATKLRNEEGDLNLDVYTYGQPHVGDHDLVTYMENQKKGDTWRVTHGKDIVPRLPSTDQKSGFFNKLWGTIERTFIGGGYVSYYPEWWIDTDKKEADGPIPTSDIKKVTDDKSGSMAQKSGVNEGFNAHNLYFRNMSQCNSLPDGQKPQGLLKQVLGDMFHH